MLNKNGCIKIAAIYHIKIRRKELEMNIYDTVNRLAKEIKESQEYGEYKKLKQQLETMPEIKQKLEEFEKARYEVQLAGIQGSQVDSQKTEKMQQIYLELIQNDFVKQYFDAELKFNVILGDINKIIAEAVQDVLK